MASARIEKIKRIVLECLASDSRTSLTDLWDIVAANPDELAGALQSLIMLDEIWVSGPIGGPPEKIYFYLSGIEDDNPANILSKEDKKVAAKKITGNISRLQKKQSYRLQQLVADLLTDGFPRTGEQIAEAVGESAANEWFMKTLAGIPGVLMQPDKTYIWQGTLTDKENSQQNHQINLQRNKIDEILRDGAALSGEEISLLLGEPLFPEAVVHLILLTNGKYTHPDSTTAWEDAARYLANSEPVNRKSFTQIFKRHKKLVTLIAKGREEPPFVILPNGRVTVETHPAGAEELRRRELLGFVHYSLKQKMGGRSFFSLSDFAPRERRLAREEALQAGCLEIRIGRDNLFCAPIKASPAAMAQELQSYTGLNLPFKEGKMTPPGFLLDNSYTAREAARVLGVHSEDMEVLLEAGYLQSFQMEGVPRYWRVSVDNMHRSPNMERILRRSEKIKTRDAARILGITHDQIKQLIKGDYLHSVGYSDRGHNLLCRGDVEDLLIRLPDIRSRWEEASRQSAEKTVRRKIKRPQRRKTTSEVPKGPLVLDEYQQKSIDALLQGHSLLVAAPTGTGKTLIAERLVEHVLDQERGVIYTSPIKALSNQKYRDFVRQYGYDRVGLITGDVSVNERAQLLVMTTEIFRNWCFTNPEWMEYISHVIFDEVHYLDDIERGTAWEESIIFAPPHMRILGLSATVPNIYEIARWIEHVRGSKVLVVEEYRRAVPLVINWLTPDYEILNEDEALEEIRRYSQTMRHRQYIAAIGAESD